MHAGSLTQSATLISSLPQPGICADKECPVLGVLCRNELLVAAAVASLAGTTYRKLISQGKEAEELGFGAVQFSQLWARSKLSILATPHQEWRNLAAKSLCLEPVWCV